MVHLRSLRCGAWRLRNAVGKADCASIDRRRQHALHPQAWRVAHCANMQELLFPPSFGFINRQPPPPPPPTSFADELKSCVTDPLSCRELSAAVAVAAVLVTLVLLRRNTARKSKRKSNAARNDEIAAYHEAHSIDIEPTVLSLLRARWGRAHWYDVSPKEALASVLMQLGEKAWILLSTATALLAIGVQWLAQHVQKRRSSSAFGGFGAKFEAMAAQMLSRAEKLVARARFSICLLYTSPSPRDGLLSRMPSSA